MFMPKTPPAQNVRRLVRPTVARRHCGVDLTTRADATPPTPAAEYCSRALCKPTAPVVVRDMPDTAIPTNRGLMMPRRKQTRAQNRAAAIDDERRHNQPWAAQRIAERNKPPPF